MGRLPALSREYYSNILLLTPDNSPLSTISEKRANWYLRKGLAQEMPATEGYARNIRLIFEPQSRSSNDFQRQTLATRCVVCGSKEQLTIHHVVPLGVKKHLNPEDKEHTRQWCVLVCEDHHIEAEKLSRPLYEKGLQESVQSTRVGVSRPLAVLRAELRKAAHAKNWLDVLEPDLIYINQRIDSEKKQAKLQGKVAQKEWVSNLVRSFGGVPQMFQAFKNAFLKLEPRFLATGFLQDYVD